MDLREHVKKTYMATPPPPKHFFAAGGGSTHSPPLADASDKNVFFYVLPHEKKIWIFDDKPCFGMSPLDNECILRPLSPLRDKYDVPD